MTEKNDQKTDSMTEEEEESLLDSEEQETNLMQSTGLLPWPA